MKREEAINDIRWMAKVESMSFEAKLREIVLDGHQCAGYWHKDVEEEVNAMSINELLDFYIMMYTPVGE